MVPIFINGHKIYDPPFFLPQNFFFPFNKKPQKLGKVLEGRCSGGSEGGTSLGSSSKARACSQIFTK